MMFRRTTLSGIVHLFLFQFAFTQHEIRGFIVDTDSVPIPHATVQIGDRGTETDSSGFFILEFNATVYDKQVIAIQCLGYKPKVKRILPSTDTLITIVLDRVAYLAGTVELVGNWTSSEDPFTFTEVTEDGISERNLGQDVPFILKWTPSAVVTSDAGTGIGYTGIRIRGSDATRINVTIDGIPLNDAESQGVFWVDLPDFSSSVERIQIQRGVGTSTDGAGAFGGTVSIRTVDFDPEPSVKMGLSGGSFNTLRTNVQFSSGLVKERLSLQGRLSRISSGGYIDRSEAKLRSLFLSANYITDRSSLKFNVISGKEITYQAWNGVPAQYIDVPYLRTYNTAGLKTDGTFHPDEVDNYRQTHVYTIYNRQTEPGGIFKLGVHYTRGKGYFEQFRNDDVLANYNLPVIPVLDSTITRSDLIRRRWLDNDFYGTIFSWQTPFINASHDLVVGGAFNRYIGRHFGEVIWTRRQGDFNTGVEYYRNRARKEDMNIYAKWKFRFSEGWQLFTDLQLRKVHYSFLGYDMEQELAIQDVNHLFFNPKAGLVYSFAPRRSLYYSFGVGQREPNRDDYVDSSPASRPKAELLLNSEIGFRAWEDHFSIGINGFHMYYKDQLILSGQINDVGEYTRINTPKSYRLGLELTALLRAGRNWTFQTNATLSRNKIDEFIEYVDDWDTGNQQVRIFRDSDLAFSPNLILQSGIQYEISSLNLKTGIFGSYVGRQYLDNTSSEFTQLSDYFYADLNVNWLLFPRWIKQLQLQVLVRNIFGNSYITNGWTYRFLSEGYDPQPDDPYASRERGTTYNLSGFYPQAGRNILVGLVVEF